MQAGAAAAAAAAKAGIIDATLVLAQVLAAGSAVDKRTMLARLSAANVASAAAAAAARAADGCERLLA